MLREQSRFPDVRDVRNLKVDLAVTTTMLVMWELNNTWARIEIEFASSQWFGTIFHVIWVGNNVYGI